MKARGNLKEFKERLLASTSKLEDLEKIEELNNLEIETIANRSSPDDFTMVCVRAGARECVLILQQNSASAFASAEVIGEKGKVRPAGRRAAAGLEAADQAVMRANDIRTPRISGVGQEANKKRVTATLQLFDKNYCADFVLRFPKCHQLFRNRSTRARYAYESPDMSSVRSGLNKTLEIRELARGTQALNISDGLGHKEKDNVRQ
ncbi:hypothetical protein EVAR_53051_1 [Eumeta japonica]|uniref:Uncharacterized protein n=1 Tax=Eumeta variegata TaxID=151549 RepID=A0A4C1YXW5_EUMVA|nr:hypothetical protein EVAR_53051_1 [Eumeta japonica]